MTDFCFSRKIDFRLDYWPKLCYFNLNKKSARAIWFTSLTQHYLRTISDETDEHIPRQTSPHTHAGALGRRQRSRFLLLPSPFLSELKCHVRELKTHVKGSECMSRKYFLTASASIMRGGMENSRRSLTIFSKITLINWMRNFAFERKAYNGTV